MKKLLVIALLVAACGGATDLLRRVEKAKLRA
jgi:hypothetical protein